MFAQMNVVYHNIYRALYAHLQFVCFLKKM